jgi:hypothetical protein
MLLLSVSKGFNTQYSEVKASRAQRHEDGTATSKHFNLTHLQLLLIQQQIWQAPKSVRACRPCENTAPSRIEPRHKGLKMRISVDKT